MFRNTPSQRNTPLNREPERENLAKERNHNENDNKVFIKQVILYVKQGSVSASHFLGHFFDFGPVHEVKFPNALHYGLPPWMSVKNQTPHSPPRYK